MTNNCSQSSETYELIESNQYGNLVNETPNEFNNLLIQLKTSGVTAGTVVPFTISGSNITLEDFVGLSSLQGTFTVGDMGSDGNFLLAGIGLQIAADSTTEGPETFRITLDNHQTVFLDITIQDTSLSPTTSNYEITLMNNYSQSNVDEDWHKEWVESRLVWWENQGVSRESLELYDVPSDELAHYSKATVDIMYKFPHGVEELEGIANRTDFDLGSHSKDQKELNIKLMQGTHLTNISVKKSAINMPDLKQSSKHMGSKTSINEQNEKLLFFQKKSIFLNLARIHIANSEPHL